MNKKHDKRYLMLAKEVSTWSKDPSSQVGVVVVGDKGQVLSQGFNGFPRGIDDTIERLFNSIVLDDEDICYKYIISLYNIFELLDKQYIIINKDNLINLSNKKISRRIIHGWRRR